MLLGMKRVYDPKEESDGRRILVDRLWPRGLSKDRAAVDLWLKEIAPSTDLRQWFHSGQDNWAEFRRRYIAELKDNEAAVGLLEQNLKEADVTLLYGAKDDRHNHAVVLAEFMRGR